MVNGEGRMTGLFLKLDALNVTKEEEEMFGFIISWEFLSFLGGPKLILLFNSHSFGGCILLIITVWCIVGLETSNDCVT